MAKNNEDNFAKVLEHKVENGKKFECKEAGAQRSRNTKEREQKKWERKKWDRKKWKQKEAGPNNSKSKKERE